MLKLWVKYMLFAFFISAGPAVAQTGQVGTIEKSKLFQDMSLMLATFEKVQVNAYRHISKAELQRKADSILASLPGQVELKAAFISLSQIAALVNDAHSYVDNYSALVEDYRRSQVFPLTVGEQASAGGLTVLVNAEKGSSIRLGDTLVSINGYDVGQLFTQAAGLQGGLASYKGNEARNNFSYHLFLLGLHGPFAVSYRSASGELVQQTLKGVSYQDFSAAHSSRPSADFSFELLANGVGYISFNAMSGMKKFKVFLDSTFASLKKSHPKGLIVDIRYNGGGNSDLGELLLSYLSEKPYRLSSGRYFKVSAEYQEFMKVNYPDQSAKQVLSYLKAKVGSVLYFPYRRKNYMPDNPFRYPLKTAFLIGPQNLSSATMLADGAQAYGLATLIGEPTGAPANDGGESYSFKLPSTGFQVYTSSTFDIRANGRKRDISAVLPDLWVREERSGPRDAILERAIKWVLATGR